MSGIKSAFELPIRIYYRPPASLIYFLTISHVAGIICVFLAAVPALPEWVLCVSAAFSYCMYLRSYIHSRRHPVYIVLQPNDEWLVIDPSGSGNPVSRATTEPGAFVHPLLTVMTLNIEGHRCAFILTSGNTDTEVLRRLRVRLRFPIL